MGKLLTFHRVFFFFFYPYVVLLVWVTVVAVGGASVLFEMSVPVHDCFTLPFSSVLSLFCNPGCPESKKLSLCELRELSVTLGHTLFQTCGMTVSPGTGKSLSQGG